MANDQRLGPHVHKFASRTAICQHFITQVFKDSFKFNPLDVGGNWLSTEPFKGFLMFRHIVAAAHQQYIVTEKQLPMARRCQSGYQTQPTTTSR